MLSCSKAYLDMRARGARFMIANIDEGEIETIEAFAHCDGPCGVYDPASARVAGEAVQSMTKKMLGLTCPDTGEGESMAAYLNTMSRYAAIKEEEAQKCKDELLVLWTDFYKPQHLEANPNLHQTFWQAAKLCSACKVEVSAVHAQELMDAIEEIHNQFWTVKGREVPWIRAS
jgi:nickel superoxide dismutase